MNSHLAKAHKLNEFQTKYMKKGEIDDVTRHLSNFFVSSAVAFRVLENEDFVSFVRSLNPNYKLPDRAKLKETIMLRYNETKIELFNLFKNVEYISITTDGWIARYIKSAFISLTAHYLDKDFLFKSVKLGIFPMNISHTGENLKDEIIKILDDYEIKTKVKAIVTDHAGNMNVLCNQLGIFTFGCIAHLLHLVVQRFFQTSQIFKKCKEMMVKENSDSNENNPQQSSNQNEDNSDEESEERDSDESEIDLDSCDDDDDDDDAEFIRDSQSEEEEYQYNENDLNEIKEVSEDVVNVLVANKRIYNLFNKSTMTNKSFLDSQPSKPKSLLNDVSNRWNSTYLMVKRFMEVESYVTKTIKSEKKLNKKYSKYFLTKNQKETANNLVEILKPFFETTEKLR